LLRLSSATDVGALSDLQLLSCRLASYYQAPEMDGYFRLAHSINADWSQNRFHRQIMRLCTPGMSIVDLGCGSAHAYDNLGGLGIHYVGVDWSGEQIERNRARFGEKAAFVTASLYDTGLEGGQFDLVMSLFTLEHLVFPHLFLHEAVRLARPGGLIVILCPSFRPYGRIPSLDFGGEVAPLRKKLAGGHARDALRHFFLRNLYYPWVLKRRYPRDRYPFLINLEPSCLRGVYYPDNDAVYFVDRDEVIRELSQLGAGPDPEIGDQQSKRGSTCLVVVRRHR
jgi:SAM-dependent methyltransferase